MHNGKSSSTETDLTALADNTILFLVPLIQMAWAHGAISPREKRVIFDAAREDGIDERHRFNETLDRWLVYQPSAKFFGDCLKQIEERKKMMTVKEREQIRKKVLSRCRRVAETAGDSSPMDTDHRVSSEEKILLDELTDIFK